MNTTYTTNMANTITASLTSFSKLFGHAIDQNTITRIVIPQVQRDYAQGRKTPTIDRIRSNFVNVVCSALLPNSPPVELDFIYGDVTQDGEFTPLDGQQRLTLLFLLHCYLSWRVGVIQAHDKPWARFDYATRPGARDFCAFLAKCRPDFTADNSSDFNALTDSRVSSWLIDQPDYLPTWDYDPTIQSMLVVLDEIHNWFAKNCNDFHAAWEKLTSVEQPAIRFHLLPMAANDMVGTHAQYIKMNSRGKPLTPFENFKVQFEELVKKAHPDLANDLAHKLDTDWSDILWPYRGKDNLIDDSFMRYFRFITEVCAWNSGLNFVISKRFDEVTHLIDLSEKIYGSQNAKSKENLNFLFHAFDTWKGKNIKNEFECILTADRGQIGGKLFIFGQVKSYGVDFFRACCLHYGSQEWDLANTLLLYGVLLKRELSAQNADAKFSKRLRKRLRKLRNLIVASGDRIRAEDMPDLLDDVRKVIQIGAISKVGTFNQAQKQNELDKADMLRANRHLQSFVYQLEDHDLLRGGLTAFDLNPSNPSLFESRAKAFLKIFDKSSYSADPLWVNVTGALLAQGDYSKRQRRWTGYTLYEFAAPEKDEPWRALFRRLRFCRNAPGVQEPLMSLLDAFAKGKTLQAIIDAYLNDGATLKDWRYYLVKYPVMRTGNSGRYVFSYSGYEACMLDKLQMNSYYYDPYLFAAFKSSGINACAVSNSNWPRAFYGYESESRWIELKKSGIKLRSVDDGWRISDIPSGSGVQSILQQEIKALKGVEEAACANGGILIKLQKKKSIDGIKIDAVDRVEVAASLFCSLVQKGL